MRTEKNKIMKEAKETKIIRTALALKVSFNIKKKQGLFHRRYKLKKIKEIIPARQQYSTECFMDAFEASVSAIGEMMSPYVQLANAPGHFGDEDDKAHRNRLLPKGARVKVMRMDGVYFGRTSVDNRLAKMGWLLRIDDIPSGISLN